ncbi:MAG: LamG domain-containing protein, partial [Candidatus Bathyarchaeota archaeon]
DGVDMTSDTVDITVTDAGFLIGHWAMDDNASTTTVVDSSAYGNHGTARQNTSVLHTTGIIDGALTFNGSTDYVDLSGLGSTLEVENISVSVWAKPDSVTGPINWILGNGAQFRLGFGDDTVRFWIREQGRGSSNLVSGGSVSAGKWYHIVGTYDGTYQKLYVNGSLVASEQPGLDVLDNGSDNFAIGKAYKTSKEYFDGNVDDVRIFSRALSEEAINVLYNEQWP